MVRIGDMLGLYKALHAKGAMTSEKLAATVGADERYVREWLSHQAASNYLAYDPATRKFALPEEQAMIFAVEESPFYMLGGFDLMAAMLNNQPKVESAFRTGGGVAWGDQAGCMFLGFPNVLLSREEFSGQNSRPRSAVSLLAERPFPALWEGARRDILGAVLGEGFPDLGPPRSGREGFRLFAGEREAARPI